jgi:LacI family transcriptional regulator/LacI family repressor for deo operon, udp, cdd, tsx, nupC, and nupG
MQSPPPSSHTISSKHHATILDIASKLKISKSTVSRALRNSKEINQETRNAVLKMAQQLNYVPNYFASSLVRRKSYSIGIVVPELITNFFSQFIIIAQKAASLAGYEVVICHSNENYSNEMDVLKRLFAYQVDGILLSLSSETKSLEHLQAFEDAGVPVILFNRVKNRPGFPKVLATITRARLRALSILSKTATRKLVISAGRKICKSAKTASAATAMLWPNTGLSLIPTGLFTTI